jgi:hypothetical protein
VPQSKHAENYRRRIQAYTLLMTEATAINVVATVVEIG